MSAKKQYETDQQHRNADKSFFSGQYPDSEAILDENFVKLTELSVGESSKLIYCKKNTKFFIQSFSKSPIQIRPFFQLFNMVSTKLNQI